MEEFRECANAEGGNFLESDNSYVYQERPRSLSLPTVLLIFSKATTDKGILRSTNIT